MKKVGTLKLFCLLLPFVLNFSACRGGKTSVDDPDGSVIDGGEDDIDGDVENGFPVGSQCTEDPECSGPDPVCLQEDIAPLAAFSDSDNDIARDLARSVVIPMPDSYCSNTAPCATDADCGIGGRCFLPLADVDEEEYASLVSALSLSEEEEVTLVGFHSYGQCLKPCESDEDCVRPGYHCAVPLEDFLVLVESIGARMETYCIGEPGDPCDPDPCANGTCIDNEDGTFFCDCNEGWTGEFCDIEDPCQDDPCVNGTCVDNGDGTFTCDCEFGWTGELCDMENPCEPDPCANGTCIDNGDGTFTCDCNEGWIGDLCDEEDPDMLEYCDIVYEFTGTFRVSDAPLGCNSSNTIHENTTVPDFDNDQTTPFTPAEFPKAFIRLRFPNDGGNPAQGPVSLVEYYLPIEFTISCGPSVTTDVDHSVGLLEMSGSPPEVQPSPNLYRPCRSWAVGQLSGTTLDWSECDVVPPETGNDWSHEDAQAEPGDTTTACAMRMSVWGHVSCSGLGCGLVPELGNQLETWDQFLNNFTFSSTDYTDATFSMDEVQVPESTNANNTRTWVTIDLAEPIFMECGVVTQLTCDQPLP